MTIFSTPASTCGVGELLGDLLSWSTT